jgi:hypothetical protein
VGLAPGGGGGGGGGARDGLHTGHTEDGYIRFTLRTKTVHMKPKTSIFG